MVVAVVDTPEQLVNAVKQGEEHIHIVEHLDLSDIDPGPYAAYDYDEATVHYVLFLNAAMTQSLTVRSCRPHRLVGYFVDSVARPPGTCGLHTEQWSLFARMRDKLLAVQL